MALSRRDWNNVIIYSVLAMLLLFYFAPKHLMTLRQQHLQSFKLVPDGYVLVQLQFEVMYYRSDIGFEFTFHEKQP